MRYGLMIALVLAWVGTGFGEPSPTVRYLMSEPVTMWDWGIYGLSKRLDERITSLEGQTGGWGDPKTFEDLDTVGQIFGNVDYKWDANRLVLRVFGWTETVKKMGIVVVSDEVAENNCKRVIADIKRSLGIDPETGKPSSGEQSSSGLFFSHSSFTPKDEPLKLWGEIDNMISIMVSWNTGKKRSVQLETPLLGTKLLRVTDGK
ncbi:MAG: hypothetical protein JW384_00600 [Nitrosomonadaceae bacterium]|nr:hypothetical protein [Nitrosomonadaceae bacterium]